MSIAQKQNNSSTISQMYTIKHTGKYIEFHSPVIIHPVRGGLSLHPANPQLPKNVF